MKSLFTFLVAVLMVLSFSLAGFAESAMTGGQGSTQGQTTVTEKKTEPMESGLSITGKVVWINMKHHTMLVKGQEDQWRFDVSKVPDLGTVKKGETVQVTYTKEHGRMIASSVVPSKKMSLNEPPYGYDPYYGWDPHFYGYDPYQHG